MRSNLGWEDTHAGVRCGISATRNSLRSQVPQKSKSPFATFMPSPDVHTPATRCRRSSAARARRPRQPAEAATPSIYFLCRDPGAGFAPSCLGECAIAARHEPEHRTMWYRKNVGGWERAARLIGGGLMVIFGVGGLGALPPRALLHGAAVLKLRARRSG